MWYGNTWNSGADACAGRTGRFGSKELRFSPTTAILSDTYDAIYVANALETLPKLGRFDVGLCCDVIEHFEKPVGRKLLDHMLNCCNTVILTTPVSLFHQDGVLQDRNGHQQHLSHWTDADFAGTEEKLVILGCAFGAVISKRSGAPWPKMQQRFDHVGVRLLPKASARRAYLKATGRALQ